MTFFIIIKCTSISVSFYINHKRIYFGREVVFHLHKTPFILLDFFFSINCFLS